MSLLKATLNPIHDEEFHCKSYAIDRAPPQKERACYGDPVAFANPFPFLQFSMSAESPGKAAKPACMNVKHPAEVSSFALV
ncbi:hypothetical protein M513_11250 [Trichuris suis]|uniref:Uncharacterized protein n=1 Tax=Trichuris suis TaxID=68888 RepID=A0A085LSF1_9BILA|nr:hypothetical protein M513_11250 [Trichuris suis]